MKSGLGDRNNLKDPSRQATVLPVSMKSGLRDRNNLAIKAIGTVESDLSQ